MPARPRAKQPADSRHQPYLLLHAHNPVDGARGAPGWTGQREDKRSSEHRSMPAAMVPRMRGEVRERQVARSQPRVVSIKVDREENARLDDIYMTATCSTTGAGGLAQERFLTPRASVLRGTYFPPESRVGGPRVQGTSWCRSPPLARAALPGCWSRPGRSPNDPRLSGTGPGPQRHRPQNGGWPPPYIAVLFDPRRAARSAPTTIPPLHGMSLMLARTSYARRAPRGQTPRAGETTLVMMARGGIYDPLRGIARYSTDPHGYPAFREDALRQAQCRSGLRRGKQVTESRFYADGPDIFDTSSPI